MENNPQFGLNSKMSTHSGHYEISAVIWNEISQGYLKILTKALSVGEDLNDDKSVLLDITKALTLSVSMAKEMSLGAGSIIRSSCKRIGQFRHPPKSHHPTKSNFPNLLPYLRLVPYHTNSYTLNPVIYFFTPLHLYFSQYLNFKFRYSTSFHLLSPHPNSSLSR